VISYTHDELMAFAFAENDLGDLAWLAGDITGAQALYQSCKEALALARLAAESEDR
jgi:hypothetical protein